MPTIDRRTLFGTAAGLAGAGLIGRADAAESPAPAPTPADQPIDTPVARPATQGAPQQQPAALDGAVSGTNVTLPHLFADSELEGSVPNLDPPSRRLGVAVVGLGHLSLGQILPGFGTARHVRLAAVVSGNKAKGRAIADQHGLPSTGVYDYDTFDDIAHDRSIDIVYIVLPNSMHAEFTVRAARAGKHVLCEKPMATTVADAERMIAACRDAKRLLMIAYRLQYDPTHRLLIATARSGDHGPVRYIEAANLQNNADNGQWRHIRALAGGGSLPDVGLYCLNAARYITGEEPIEINASVDSPEADPRFREIEDFCRFSLRFPSGALASCTSAYSVHMKRTLSVSTPKASFVVDPAFDYTNLALRFEQKAGETPSRDERRFPPRSQFAAEMDAFALSIRAGTVPHTPGEEGLQDMKLMAAIYEAAGSGRSVKLPRVSGLDVTRGPLPS
jgi:predicted dehydrogenase